VSVLNVVEAIDGPIHLNLCVPGASGCERSLACAVHPVWVEAREALIKVLGRATMDRLARKRRTVQGASTSELGALGRTSGEIKHDTNDDTGEGSLP